MSNSTPIGDSNIPQSGQIPLEKEKSKLFLISGLKTNSTSQIPNFQGRFIEYLPPRSFSSSLVQKVSGLAPLLMKPMEISGITERAVAPDSIRFFDIDNINPLNEVEQRVLDFNLVPPVPTYQLELGASQRLALAALIEKSDNKFFKSLAAKYLSGQYTLADLTVKERRALDEVNFLALQNYFKDLQVVLSDSGSYLSKFANLEQRYQYRDALIAEVLSKAMAYNPSLDGKKIDIPVEMSVEGDENVKVMKLVTFTIKKSYIGNELPFYILEPISPLPENQESGYYATSSQVEKQARAWIIIRGTEPLMKKDKEGVHEALAADLIDSAGVSSLPLLQVSDQLLKELTRAARGTEKGIQKPFNIAGHSLGGTLAQSMAVLFNPLVHQSYAFNSPGVDSYIHNLYGLMGDKENPHKLTAAQKKIIVFHRKGDFISSVSPKRIGQNYQIDLQGSPRESNNPLIKHSDNMLNTLHIQYSVDIAKDDSRWIRRVAEWVRANPLAFTTRLILSTKDMDWITQEKELRDFNVKYTEYQRQQQLKKEDQSV